MLSYHGLICPTELLQSRFRSSDIQLSEQRVLRMRKSMLSKKPVRPWLDRPEWVLQPWVATRQVLFQRNGGGFGKSFTMNYQLNNIIQGTWKLFFTWALYFVSLLLCSCCVIYLSYRFFLVFPCCCVWGALNVDLVLLRLCILAEIKKKKIKFNPIIHFVVLGVITQHAQVVTLCAHDRYKY